MNHYGKSVLTCAVESKNTELVQYLLQKKADVNATGRPMDQQEQQQRFSLQEGRRSIYSGDSSSKVNMNNQTMNTNVSRTPTPMRTDSPVKEQGDRIAMEKRMMIETLERETLISDSHNIMRLSHSPRPSEFQLNLITPLLAACRVGSLDITKILLEADAD